MLILSLPDVLSIAKCPEPGGGKHIFGANFFFFLQPIEQILSENMNWFFKKIW